MKLNTAILALVIAGLAVGVGAEWFRGRTRVREAAQKVAAAEARASAAEAYAAARETEKQQLEKALAAEQQEVAALETKAKEDAAHRETKRRANAATKQTARATEVAAKASGGSAETWAANAADPAVMRRMSEQARLQVNRRYGPLFAQLALTAEQKEQLTKLLVDKRQTAADVAAATYQGGGDPRDDPTGYVDMIAATREDLDKQIHDLLGDDGFQNYQNFDRGIGQSQVVDRLNQLLADIRQPLSAEQASRLQATMQANNTGRVSGKVVNDAAAFLSPEQLQTLRDLRAIQQANSKKRNAPAQPLPVGQ